MAKLPKEITDEIYQSGYEKGKSDGARDFAEWLCASYIVSDTLGKNGQKIYLPSGRKGQRMTEQIKSALEVLGTYDMSDDNDDTEFKDSIKLSIRSLEAWEEVLEELEEVKVAYYKNSAVVTANTIQLVIDFINHNLAEVQNEKS